jgi:hypothetical protein
MSMTVMAAIGFVIAQTASGQSIQLPWSGFAHTPQHGCVSMVPSQPLNRILWTMPLGAEAYTYTHFSSPVVTRSNTVIFPGVIGIKAMAGATGQTNWEQSTDYSGPTFCPVALTPKNRLYFAGAGGTVFYCDSPDATAPPTFTRAAFYGLNQYQANTNGFNQYVSVCTPITSDRYGNIFFGFQSLAGSPLGKYGGLARIDFDGSGSWISAPSNMMGFTNVFRPVVNCAPALSPDQKTVYIALNIGPQNLLAAMDSRTLAPLASVLLIDPETKNAAATGNDSTASPTVGPDGDVYYGVLGNSGLGWLLHFDSSLTVAKTPGPFGWDVTDSIVNASLVPSYHGNSSYLLATKYNHYYGARQYRMVLLDPQQSALDSQSGVTVMAVALGVPSPALFEWCVNSVAVDPFTKSILANNEDSHLYRWDLTSNQLTESIELSTDQSGQAYTPTLIGPDGIVYAINHGTLFAVGK